MIAIIIILLLVILIGLAVSFYFFNQPDTQKEPPKDGFKQCPLCLKILKQGEQVRTIAYPGKEERLVHLYGCPDCQKGKSKARCPICNKRLKPTDYLIGKLWEEEEKNRVHVIGCNRC